MDRKRLRGILQVGLSALLLALILRQIEWTEVRDALLRIDLRWLAVGWVLFLVGMAVRALRWRVLLDALGVHRTLGELTGWYFVGGFFNVILPTGFGGDAVRAAELAQDARRTGAVINSVVVDRYLGIIVLLAMGIVAALARPGVAPPQALAAMAALFAAGIAAPLIVRSRWVAGLAEGGGMLGKAARAVRLPSLARAVGAYDAPTLVRGLTASLAFNLLQIGWNVAIAAGLGLRLPLASFVALVPLTAVALLLPAFGGLGVRELSYVGLFGAAGVPEPVALALSLGVYIITVATGLIGGLLYLGGGLKRARTEP